MRRLAAFADLSGVERRAQARPSWFVPTCAAAVALLVTGLLTSCLNPMPEELPSDRESSGSGPAVQTPGTAAGDTSGGLPGSGTGAAPADSSGNDNPASPPSSSPVAGEPNEAPAAGGVDADTAGDAGVGADAGAPNTPSIPNTNPTTRAAGDTVP